MPTIVPPSRDQLGETIAALEALGGKAKTDFRLSRTRTGDAVLDVSDELYAKWDQSTGTDADESGADSDADDKSGADDKSAAPKPASRNRR